MADFKATFRTGLSGDRIACVMRAISVAEYPLLHNPPIAPNFPRVAPFPPSPNRTPTFRGSVLETLLSNVPCLRWGCLKRPHASFFWDTYGAPQRRPSDNILRAHGWTPLGPVLVQSPAPCAHSAWCLHGARGAGAPS